MVRISYSPIYKYSLPEGHRFPMDKYELLPEQLLYEGTLTKDNFFHPDCLSDADILLTHTKEYLDKLNQNVLSQKEERKIGFPMRPDLVTRGKHIACGTYQCTLAALQNGVALNIAGGTHHSFADHGEGFCVFNDIAIAANMLLEKGQVDQILVVDLDVHQGNGTAKIFENKNRVFTFSMHGSNNYPLRKEHSDLDIGIEDGTTDKLYLSKLYNLLPLLISKVNPDLIFYLSGVDIIESDRLGRLSVSRDGCKERDRFVFQMAKDQGIPVVVSMGGGYSPQIRDIIDAHANTFRVAMDIYG